MTSAFERESVCVASESEPLIHPNYPPFTSLTPAPSFSSLSSPAVVFTACPIAGGHVNVTELLRGQTERQTVSVFLRLQAVIRQIARNESAQKCNCMKLAVWCLAMHD